MSSDSECTSSWFTFNAGFKVYGRCPQCYSPALSYYKDRRTGLKGISHLSKGLTPVCLDCGQGLPQFGKKVRATQGAQKSSIKTA